MPEKGNLSNKTCPVDGADHFGVLNVLSTRLDALQQHREDPYEARESVNTAFFSHYFLQISVSRVPNFSVAARLLSADIGGFGGLVPSISARPDPCPQGIVDGTPGSPRPTERLIENKKQVVVGTLTPRSGCCCGRDFDPPAQTDATVDGTMTPR